MALDIRLFLFDRDHGVEKEAVQCGESGRRVKN